MNKRPFLSVVIPVYNVEKHLEKAVSSVQNQSVKDVEIILVDDCSPDNCPEICDRLAVKDERIHVIHHSVNKGLSEARNSGLEVASGEYIWFMDSDDYIDDGLFQQAKESLEKNKAQVIIFGLTEDYYDLQDNLHHSIVVPCQEKCFSDQYELRDYIIKLETKTLYGYAWNKFYDLEYLRSLGLKYETIVLIEDILFNVKYFMDINTMNLLKFTGYHYNKRMDNSLTSKFVPEYYEVHRKRIELIYNQYQHWDMCTEKIKETLGALYARYIFSAIQRNCDEKAQMTHRNRKQWITELLQDELVSELIPYARSNNKVLNILISFLKRKNEMALLMLGRIIFVCKTRCPMFFSRVKQKR